MISRFYKETTAELPPPAPVPRNFLQWPCLHWFPFSTLGPDGSFKNKIWINWSPDEKHALASHCLKDRDQHAKGSQPRVLNIIALSILMLATWTIGIKQEVTSMEPYVPAILLRFFRLLSHLILIIAMLRTVIILKKLYNFPKVSQYTPLYRGPLL